MQKKAVEEHELELPPQQQQQKGEKGAASKQAGSVFAEEGARTTCEQQRATAPTQCRARCTAGVARQDPDATVSRRRPWCACGGAGRGAGSSKQRRCSRCTRVNMRWGEGQREGVG